MRVNSRKNGGEPSGRELTRNSRVAATFLDHQKLSPPGNLIQSVLAEEDLVEQRCHVQLRTDGQETPLCLFCNILSCQHPCAWCLCRVVYFGDVAPGPFSRRSFWLGRNQFTMRCRAKYSRFRRPSSAWVSCRSYPTNVRMTELFFSSTWALSFPWHGQERVKVMSQA
jgi:hypothetical protein